METRPVNCAVRVALVPPVDGRPAPCLTPPRPCAICLLSTSHSSRSSYCADRRRANVYVACRDHARLSKTFRAFNYRPRLVPANFFQSMGRGRSGARAIIPLYRDPMPLKKSIHHPVNHFRSRLHQASILCNSNHYYNISFFFSIYTMDFFEVLSLCFKYCAYFSTTTLCSPV